MADADRRDFKNQRELLRIELNWCCPALSWLNQGSEGQDVLSQNIFHSLAPILQTVYKLVKYGLLVFCQLEYLLFKSKIKCDWIEFDWFFFCFFRVR